MTKKDTHHRSIQACRPLGTVPELRRIHALLRRQRAGQSRWVHWENTRKRSRSRFSASQGRSFRAGPPSPTDFAGFGPIRRPRRWRQDALRDTRGLQPRRNNSSCSTAPGNPPACSVASLAPRVSFGGAQFPFLQGYPRQLLGTVPVEGVGGGVEILLPAPAVYYLVVHQLAPLQHDIEGVGLSPVNSQAVLPRTPVARR